MIKSFYLTAALLLSALTGFSQDLTIDWGSSFDSNTDIQKIVGFTKNEMVAFSAKGKKRYIETYNKSDYSQISSEVFELPDIDGQSVGLLNITIADDNVLLIMYGYSKKTKSFSLYFQKLNSRGKEISKLNEFFTSEGDENKIKDARVDTRFSEDNSKMIVYFDRADKERVNFMTDVVLVDLNNPDAEPVSNQVEYKMRDGKSDNSLFNMTHTINNDGSFFHITQRTEFTKKVISNFELTVEGFTSKGEKIGESVVKDNTSLLINPYIVENKTGYTMVGYFMDNPKKRAMITGYSGLFVADFDQNINLIDIKKNEFSNEFFKDLYSERKINRLSEKGKDILVPSPYAMDNIIIHSDGTLTVLSEYYLVTITDNGKGSRTTQTNYGNIIYYKIDTEGTIVASDVVKKNQISSTSSIGLGVGLGGVSMFASFETKDQRKKYWSYAVSVKNDNVYLLFNDHKKNMEDEDGEISASLMNPSKALPYLVEITAEGKFTKKAMAEASDEDTYCVPQITCPLSETEFVIWGVRKKENKFGVATIQ